MKVVNRDVLEEFVARHTDVLQAVNSWLAEVKVAQWTKPMDIKEKYAAASFVKNHVIFNLKGNHYRLDTIVSYKSQLVFIKRIGTHKEYDKWEF